MTTENEEQGRSNRRAGKRAQRRGRDWLQDNGCPIAEVTTGPHRGDMVTGIGDLNIEITVESWEQIGKKADQAASDAAALGYSDWIVWKPRRGVGDMGGAWCVTEFRQYWRMRLELERLRRLVANDMEETNV